MSDTYRTRPTETAMLYYTRRHLPEKIKIKQFYSLLYNHCKKNTILLLLTNGDCYIETS